MTDRLSLRGGLYDKSVSHAFVKKCLWLIYHFFNAYFTKAFYIFSLFSPGTYEITVYGVFLNQY